MYINDVPWLEDHKLDQTIVFPATAYIAMATEAPSQMTGRSLAEEESVELRHVNILSALALTARVVNAGVELFTSLQRQRLSSTTESKVW